MSRKRRIYTTEYDMIVVGCGSSAYNFLKGLENNEKYKNKNIALICPSKYKENRTKLNTSDISPKFLQKENLLSLSYYLNSLKKISTDNFINLGVHGIGGMTRIWGGSIATFNEYSLKRNGFDYSNFKEYYHKIESFLPYSGNGNDLLTKGYDLPRTKSVTISNKIKKLFGSYINNTFKVGYPRLLVKESCDNCNQCLIGCHSDSVWYPTENNFLDFKFFNLEILRNTIVEEIGNSSVTVLNDKSETKKLKTKKIILGAGVIQNYKLLAKMNDFKFKKAKIYTTPAISFAFLRLSSNPIKHFFGMGNATFILKKLSKIKLYGNLYDGYSLALSKGLVFSKYFIIDKIYKFASRFMVAGAGFMSSDNTDCSINFKNNQLIIKGDYSKSYKKNNKFIMHQLKLFIKETNGITLHLKASKIGTDIHYAGGIPNSLFDKKLIINGGLKGIDNIKVIGGSTFSYLPPESPTLSFMANSYRIGENLG